MLALMRRLLDRRRTLKEVARMETRAIAELGLDRAELGEFARMPGDVPERMERMAAIHGLAPAALKRDRGAYLEMVETCGRCGARKICAEVLDSGTADPLYCGFCPNSGIYRRMARGVAY